MPTGEHPNTYGKFQTPGQKIPEGVVVLTMGIISCGRQMKAALTLSHPILSARLKEGVDLSGTCTSHNQLRVMPYVIRADTQELFIPLISICSLTNIY